MTSHTRKRQKRGPNSWANFTCSAEIDSLPHENDDILGETPIYAVQDPFTAGIYRVRSELNHATVEQSRKRGWSDLFNLCTGLQTVEPTLGHCPVDGQSGSALDENDFLSLDAQQWLKEAFPELYPIVPSLDHRSVNLNVPNPFPKDGEARHPKLREKKSAMFADGAVNGLIKFHLGSSGRLGNGSVDVPPSTFAHRHVAVHHRKNPNFPPKEQVPPLPPGFGRDGKLKLDQTDTRLLTFCEVG